MNHHSHDYPFEEMERISEPKLVKDVLNLEELLKLSLIHIYLLKLMGMNIFTSGISVKKVVVRQIA